MSRASESPVYCARRGDLGCQASHPGSRFDAIRAGEQGWFHSKAEAVAFCPAHVPEWVPAWRAKQEACQHKVKVSFSKRPAVLKCAGGDLEQAEESDDPDVLRGLRAAAFAHARESGHTVTVTTTQEMTVEAADE